MCSGIGVPPRRDRDRPSLPGSRQPRLKTPGGPQPGGASFPASPGSASGGVWADSPAGELAPFLPAPERARQAAHPDPARAAEHRGCGDPRWRHPGGGPSSASSASRGTSGGDGRLPLLSGSRRRGAGAEDAQTEMQGGLRGKR